MRKYLCIVFMILVLCFTNIVRAENETTNETDTNTTNNAGTDLQSQQQQLQEQIEQANQELKDSKF